MATSGSKSVAVTSWDTLKFTWTAKSQSVANNTTLISWTLQLVATSDGAINSSASKSWSVTVNGTKYSGTNTVGIGNNSTKTLASGTTTITHAADGSKTFSYSFSQQFDITFNSWIGTISGSGSGTLDTIPRASQPSCITWPEHTQNVGAFGDTISIHMNRASSAFTHTVRYQFGSQSGTIATEVTTGTTWTIPKSLMNLIPNTLSGSGTIYADTYNGSTKIGTKSCGFTATVPTTSDCYPTCKLTLEDTTGWDDTYGSPVQGLSKIKATVTPTLAYGSPIASYTITLDGSKYTAATATSGALKTAGSSPVTVTIKDKRGRSGSASYTMNVLAYAKPIISVLTVRRCDEDGTENEQGEHVLVTFNAGVSPLNDKNTATYTLRHKKSTSTEFTAVSLGNLANKFSLSGASYIIPADSNSSHDIEVEVKDRHNTTTRATSASTAFTLMNWGTDGKSIGMLKVAEHPGAIDIGGDIYLNGHAMYGAHGMHDTRYNNESPQWYMTNYGKGTVWEFKQLTSIGFTSPSANYGPVQTIVPWGDQSGGLPRQVAYEGRARWTRIASSLTTWGAWQSDALIAYPVGSIYIAYNHTSPATLFGGTWERLENTLLWATSPGGVIGGVSAQAAKATSGGYAFTQVSVWRRTA